MPSELKQNDIFKMNRTSQTFTTLKLGTSEKASILKWLTVEDSLQSSSKGPLPNEKSTASSKMKTIPEKNNQYKN